MININIINNKRSVNKIFKKKIAIIIVLINIYINYLKRI